MTIHIRLSADYFCHPLWKVIPGQAVRDLPTEGFGISAALGEDIDRWQAEYQDTFNDEYPPDGGFRTETALKAHRAGGERLAQRLAKSCGSASRTGRRSQAGQASSSTPSDGLAPAP